MSPDSCSLVLERWIHECCHVVRYESTQEAGNRKFADGHTAANFRLCVLKILIYILRFPKLGILGSKFVYFKVHFPTRISFRQAEI